MNELYFAWKMTRHCAPKTTFLLSNVSSNHVSQYLVFRKILSLTSEVIFIILAMDFNPKAPGRGNWTPACPHAPWFEVTSEHQPDSPRPNNSWHWKATQQGAKLTLTQTQTSHICATWKQSTSAPLCAFPKCPPCAMQQLRRYQLMQPTYRVHHIFVAWKWNK